MPQPLYLWERTTVSITQEEGWASGTIWIIGKREKSFAPHGI
jgi:hypothetical protein